jgi:hypothetical protein
MRNQIGNITLPVTSGSTFGEFLRVKLSGGVIALAGSTEDEIGVLEQDVISTDISASVIPIEDPASRQGIGSKAISQFSTVYAAANGQFSDSGTLVRGVALTACAGANAVFEYLPQRNTTAGTIATGAIQAGAVTGAKLTGPLKSGSVITTTTSGSCALTGTLVGDRVLAVFEVDTDSTATGAEAKFESTITVSNQIQQITTEASAKKYAVLLVPVAS